MQKKVYRASVFKLTSTGLLIAVGILIPVFFPKIVIGPASFTLASHVAVFIAMFISPGVAAGVALGTTAGFFIGGFSIVIVFRAASHILWALPGAFYLSKTDKFNISWYRLRVFSLLIAVIHGTAELVSVVLFYFGTGFPESFTLSWLLIFIGLGTLLHSMADMEIANVVRLVLQKQRGFMELAR